LLGAALVLSAVHGQAYATGEPAAQVRPLRAAIVRRAARVGLFCLASAGASWAQRPVPYPIVLRITGFIGTKPEGVKDVARWVVAVEGQQYTFHVTKLEPLRVDVAY